MSEATAKTVAEIASFPGYSENEVTRIAIIEYGAVGLFLDIRLWRGYEPTRHGIRFPLRQIPAMIGALRQAESKAGDIIRSLRRSEGSR